MAYDDAPMAPAASCTRYRSYDPSSGTFLGRDGRRHPCG
jgi:BA14K-like protein